MKPLRPLQRLRERLMRPSDAKLEILAPQREDSPLARRFEDIAQKIAPHALRAAARLLDEQSAGRTQLAMAQIANPLVALGFRLDPHAARLFDFLSLAEKRHGRERVLPRLVAHMALDPALGQAVAELAKNFAQIREPQAESQAAQTVSKHMGRKVLQILCELAALDHPDPMPETGPPGRWDERDIEALVTYFEAAPVSAQHLPLARMTQGIFPTAERPSHVHAAPEPNTPSALTTRPGFVVTDQTLHFVLVSYGFCLQILLLRGAIERLPEAFALLRSRLPHAR